MPLQLVKSETTDNALWQIDMLLKGIALDIHSINPVWLDECRWQIISLCWKVGLNASPANDILQMGHLVRHMIETPPEQFNNLLFGYGELEVDAAETIQIMADKLSKLAVALQNRRAP